MDCNVFLCLSLLAVIDAIALAAAAITLFSSWRDGNEEDGGNDGAFILPAIPPKPCGGGGELEPRNGSSSSSLLSLYSSSKNIGLPLSSKLVEPFVTLFWLDLGLFVLHAILGAIDGVPPVCPPCPFK